MGLTKSDSFNIAHVSLADQAKALGHPARIAILHFLGQRKACLCAEIVDHLPLAQATVSQHLKELRKAGLVRGDIDGPSVRYSIDEKIWNRTRRRLAEFFEHCLPTHGARFDAMQNLR